MIKKILFGMALVASAAACTDDYKDWAELPAVAQPATVAFADGSVTAVDVVNLNTLEAGQTLVRVANITAPTASDAAYAPVYLLNVGDAAFDLDAEGRMSADELQAYVADKFGRNPNITRTIDATVEMWESNGTTSVKTATSGVFQVKAIAQAPVIETIYYLTGNVNEWDNSNRDYPMTNGGGDVYEDPTFTLRIPAGLVDGDYEFKFTPASKVGTGDWNSCLAAGATDGTFVYDNGGGNLVVAAVEGARFYDLTFNMLELTWTATPVFFNAYIWEAGVNNNWGATEQALYCANNDGVYTGFFYALDADWSGGQGAFKFTGAFQSWDEGNYGAGTSSDEGGTIINDGGSGNLLATPGFYRADVNLATMTYTLTRINSVYVVGSAVNNDWDNGVQMTYNLEKLCWEVDTEIGEGVIKFKGNGSWDNQDGNWGGTLDNIINGSNDNIPVSVTGRVHIEFYPTCDTKSYATVTNL